MRINHCYGQCDAVVVVTVVVGIGVMHCVYYRVAYRKIGYRAVAVDCGNSGVGATVANIAERRIARQCRLWPNAVGTKIDLYVVVRHIVPAEAGVK